MTYLSSRRSPVLSPHALTIQIAQLKRKRYYDDETQHYDRNHPQDTPSWSYIEQEMYDEEYDNNMLNFEDVVDKNLLAKTVKRRDWLLG